MTTHTYTKRAVAAAVGFMALVPVLAFAQAGAAVQTNAATTVTTPAGGASLRAKVMASTTAETTRAERAKEKAAKEIDRRIASLNAIVERISLMGKVTDVLKTNLKTNVQNQINALTALKAKIEADADLATLKTDIKSIGDAYRIYVLVMPQAHIIAAADRMATIINMLVSVGTKLQARVNTARAGGADTSALDAALTDLGAKLTSAQAHAQEAVNLVAPLAPDQGDKTVMASNEAAIKKAQGEIKAGQADLVAARKDIAAIIKGLGGLKGSINATSSVQTQ